MCFVSHTRRTPYSRMRALALLFSFPLLRLRLPSNIRVLRIGLPGSVCPSGAIAPIACPFATSASLTGMSVCVVAASCDAGNYSLNGICVPCPTNGSTCSPIAATPCTPGSFAPTSGLRRLMLRSPVSHLFPHPFSVSFSALLILCILRARVWKCRIAMNKSEPRGSGPNRPRPRMLFYCFSSPCISSLSLSLSRCPRGILTAFIPLWVLCLDGRNIRFGQLSSVSTGDSLSHIWNGSPIALPSLVRLFLLLLSRVFFCVWFLLETSICITCGVGCLV
jgi:hypothetical protein